MQRSVQWLSVGAAVRVAGFTMVASFFFLYLRNVFDVGYAEIGVLVALTGVLPLAILPAAGLLADRLGRRRVLLIALLGEGLTLFVIAYTISIGWLLGLIIFVTVLQTVGAMGGPAVQAYIADFVQGSDRTMGYSWLRIASNLGFTIGVFSGGSLIAFVGFVNVALIAASMVLAAFIVLTLLLEPSPYERTRMATLSPGAVDARGAGSNSIRTSLWVIAQDRVFLALCVAVALFELTADQWVVTFPLYVNTVLGVPYLFIGAGLAVNGLVVVIGQAPMTRAVLGRRHTSLLIGGALLYVVGFLMLGLPEVLGIGIIAAFFSSVLILTLGENLQSIPLTTLPSNLAPQGDLGAYNGAFFSVAGVGSLLAPIVGGLVLATASSPGIVWGLLCLPTVPALALVALYIMPRIRKQADRA
ncbi:MAG TPA: MFS transporter [Thermoplasmata archaeon]|nr:MFS transporter [Thermoplasmata archaeon]